jgi:hypothetical protein
MTEDADAREQETDKPEDKPEEPGAEGGSQSSAKDKLPGCPTTQPSAIPTSIRLAEGDDGTEVDRTLPDHHLGGRGPVWTTHSDRISSWFSTFAICCLWTRRVSGCS